MVGLSKQKSRPDQVRLGAFSPFMLRVIVNMYFLSFRKSRQRLRIGNLVYQYTNFIRYTSSFLNYIACEVNAHAVRHLSDQTFILVKVYSKRPQFLTKERRRRRRCSVYSLSETTDFCFYLCEFRLRLSSFSLSETAPHLS